MFLYVNCAKAYSLRPKTMVVQALDKPRFQMLSEPQLDSPIFVEGLPGFGNVGKTAASLIVEFMHAQVFAELYSPSFPDYVAVDKTGLAVPPKYDFCTAALGKTQFVILSGDTQPSREDVVAHYLLCDGILDFLAQYNCKFVVTMAGLTTPKPAGEVYVAATSAELAAKAVEKGAVLYGGGRILGAAGLLLGLAKIRDWEGMCLLGSTTGLKADRGAAYSVFKLLMKMFGSEPPPDSLPERERT
jgi:proteasome assembly chaperone (PAC2) family protein